MPSIRIEDLSPFGRLALKLDQEFADLVRAGEEIAEADLESDNGLDEGVKILNRVARSGSSMAEVLQDFSRAMEEARDKAESATRLVAERAQLIQKRREQEGALQEKLTRLKDDVKAFGETLAGSQAPGGGAPTEADKKKIADELARLQAPMIRFIEDVQAIKAEAASARFRRVERQAEAMLDSLQSSRRKIEHALATKKP